MPIGTRLHGTIPSLGEQKVSGTITKRDFIFSERRRKDSSGGGLYADGEPLAESIFTIYVTLDPISEAQLVPGTVVSFHLPEIAQVEAGVQ